MTTTPVITRTAGAETGAVRRPAAAIVVPVLARRLPAAR